MDGNQSLTRFLAFALLVCCAGTGLCVSLLGFTWATGDLPFGLSPLMAPAEGKAEETVQLEEDREYAGKQRYGEVYASRLYSALQKERDRLAIESKRLAERELELKEFEKTADMLAAKLEAAAERARALLDYTDATERANVQHLSIILAGGDAPAGAKLLLSLPPATAARLIKALEARRAAEMVNALATEGDASGKSTGLKEILAALQKLSSKEPPEPRDVGKEMGS